MAWAKSGSGLDNRTNSELCSLYVRGERKMIRIIIEETIALLSIALFVGMITVWADVLSSGW